MHWFRVDNRLVHGQIIEAWLPYTGARYLVVANDELANDILRQQIVSLAVPQRVTMYFTTLENLVRTLRRCPGDAFILLEQCRDAVRALDAGVNIPTLNVGNLHYGPGKCQLLPHVAVSPEDEAFLRRIRAGGAQLDFRSVPTETVRGLDEPIF